MGRELPSLCGVESKRLLWLIGLLIFALIITFQNGISPLFSSSKIPISRDATSEVNPSIVDNTTPALSPIGSQKSDIIEEEEEEVDRILDNGGDGNVSYGSPSPAMPPASVGLSPSLVTADRSAPPLSGLNRSLEKGSVSVPRVHGNKTDIVLQWNSTRAESNTKRGKPVSGVISISEMSERLRQSRASYRSKRPRWPVEPDQELLRARIEIENARNDDKDPALYASLYHNVSVFKRSYELMERTLKVYVYKEGKRPIMHTPELKGIYASEGWFMKLLESNKKFVTKNARKAHLFYLPFSSRRLEEALYVKDSHSHRNLIQYLKAYIDFISGKYSFWNRTSGSDHFLVACHDWAPSETRKYMANCIRAMCNSDVRDGFVFGKDTSLPETFVRDVRKPLKDLGGKPVSRRSILAFFAGQPDHGYLRPIILSYWGDNKDPDMKIFGKLPRSKGNKNYIQYMKTSKYCICAKGYEVNSPRVVEAIHYECVPVIISDNFVPPFFEVLNWKSFAVFVMEKDIPNLKKILKAIPERRYRQMQMRVKKVQKHFLWHVKPEKYDMFHMILHSVWFNRVYQISV